MDPDFVLFTLRFLILKEKSVVVLQSGYVVWECASLDFANFRVRVIFVSFIFVVSVLVFILFSCLLTATGQFTDDDAPPLPWSVESDEQIIVTRTEGSFPSLSLVAYFSFLCVCSPFAMDSFGLPSTTQSSFTFFLFFPRMFWLIHGLANACFKSL